MKHVSIGSERNVYIDFGVETWRKVSIWKESLPKLKLQKKNTHTHTVKQLPSYRTRSATLPPSEPLPTTTTGHYTIWYKKSQSCALEDGQRFARNMLTWSWRSINCYFCISLVFYITLPILMMHGQTQIKFTHTHTHTHTYIHTHTHAYIYVYIYIYCVYIFYCLEFSFRKIG